jgi:serine acetyltransferase
LAVEELARSVHAGNEDQRLPGPTHRQPGVVVVNHRRTRRRAFWRIVWTVATIIVVQTLIVALSLLPVAIVWSYLVSLSATPNLRLLIFLVAVAPSYAFFVLTLMPVSAVVTRALGWRSPQDVEMRIADMEWPLLDWVRYMAAIHLVRLLAGMLVRGTPVWTAYLRLSGARIGRRVYINTLGLSDYNLLEFGDDVVIGADVHLAGHTVEDGVVKTGSVRLGTGVTVGVGSVVEIGVSAGDGCQIGALSFVPKHTTLESGGVYVGIPVRRL